MKPGIRAMKRFLFNSRIYIENLRKGGFNEDQAKAQATALEQAFSDAETELATKKDVDGLHNVLKSDMQNLRLELKTDMQDLRLELKTDMHELKRQNFSFRCKPKFSTRFWLKKMRCGARPYTPVAV